MAHAWCRVCHCYVDTTDRMAWVVHIKSEAHQKNAAKLIPLPLTDNQIQKAAAKAKCSFCSMRATIACDVCKTNLCRKHVTTTANGDFCRDHRPGYAKASPAGVNA